MKILYAIQGTGNGHICRAKELLPEFEKYGDVDILVSGDQFHIDLDREIKYQFQGITLILGNHGGIDYYRTFAKNKLRRFIKEIQQLPVRKYDLVISDFEPISAWACYLNHVECYGISNQFALQSPGVPMPLKSDVIGRFILNSYAPVTYTYGLHFKKYNRKLYTPIIRKQIRELKPTDDGHYTVYLTNYDEHSVKLLLSAFPNTKWHVFSKSRTIITETDNITIFPIDEDLFLKSFASCTGLITAAGFGACSEALFLGKKLCVVPIKKQLEQKCNATALAEMGVTVLENFRLSQYTPIRHWLHAPKPEPINYPDNAAAIAFEIIEKKLESIPFEMEFSY